MNKRHSKSEPEGGWTIGRILQRVPDDDIQLLMTVANNLTMAKWIAGDLANTWIAHDLPAMWVYKSIADILGKHKTSVRMYAYVARKFDRDVREEYDTLGFEHFKFALKCTNPIDVLNYAKKVGEDRMGRPATIDELSMVFKGSRHIDIPDEEPIIYGGRPSLPAYSIPFQRKIFMVNDPTIKEKATALLTELCDLLEALDYNGNIGV